MKFINTIALLFFCIFLNAQEKKYILIDIQNKKEYAKNDSVSAAKFLDSLSQNHYFFTELKEVKKTENRTEIYFDKGKNFNEAYVSVSDSISKAIKTNPEFFTKNLDSLKREINKKFIDKGYSFSRIKSKFKGLKNEIPEIEIDIIPDKKRTIDGFVLKGYEKPPKRFVKNLEKEYRGKVYDEKNLLAINKSLQNHQYVALERPPQTLFTKDSTNIYLFLQKRKANSFDGIVGFGNDKTEKLTINGTLNLQFRNLFNGFESMGLYWQRTPDKGQTFDMKIDVPYLFKSNLGTNINLNIFRQDSTFANVKMLPSIYYHLSSRQKIGLRGTFETSTVLDSLYTQGKDFSKKGIGVWYDYTEPIEIELFLYKTRIRTEADFISTHYSLVDLKALQTHFYLYGERNFNISKNHWLNVKGESSLLSSKNAFTTNELMRFGGWNSMRGFNENSLLADFYYFGNVEYRYLVNDQAFFDTFLQYGQLSNKSLGLRPKLYSFGLGFNFFLPIGLMSFQISNGNEFGNTIKFNDTKIHWGILSRF